MILFQNKLSGFLLTIIITTAALIYFCPGDYSVFGSFGNSSFSHDCGISNSGFVGGADCLASHLSVASRVTGIFSLADSFLLLILSCVALLLARLIIIKKEDSLVVVLRQLFERYKIEVRATIESRLRYYLTLFNHI